MPFPPVLTALAPPDDLLGDLLAVSLTGIIFYTPVYDEAGELIDFRFAYLNPAAQRMMRMPEQPILTHTEQWPHSKAHGTFAFHVDAFVSGEPREYSINYQADGYDNYYRLAARRSGTGLLVSFTDTADQPRTAVEEALRASQAAERAAHADADAQRQRLFELNQELEARVAERTHTALVLQADLLAAAQRQAEERRTFHQVFEQTPASIALLRGPDHRFDYLNAAYQQLFPGREMLGRSVAEALPEVAAQGFVTWLDEVYRTGETFFGHEERLVQEQPDGQPPRDVYYTFTYQAYRENDHIAGISIFAYDVTEQVLARRVVEQREASFRLMADNAPAMLWVTDPAGSCTYLNQPWYDYTGQTEAQALGLGWAGAVHPDEGAAAGAAFLDASDRRVPFHCLFRLRRHDGEYRWVTDSGLPRFNEAGGFEGMVGTVIDVHEQKLAELALHRLTKKLRQSRDEGQALNTNLTAANAQLTRTNIDLDNFIYTASHDLKAPITNIEGLLATLRTELPPPTAAGEVPYILELMDGAVDRFKRTIEHLTDVSKLQKEHGHPTTLVALAPVLEDVRLDLAPLLQQTGGRLDVDVRRCPPLAVSEKNLRSVVFNLLSNALKYRHPDRPPRVRMRTRLEGAFAVLSVQDNGLGLDLAREEQLFAMFQRLHTHVEGSGLGLFMVKRMVENVGGRIEVQSQLGEGSTFSVYFPH